MVRANGIQSPLIAELMVSNVEFVREITSAKCLSRKDSRETVHFAEEAKVDYDSEESILSLEEISAIKGRGKQNNAYPALHFWWMVMRTNRYFVS